MQYEAGAFGTQLNLYDTPPTASLGTITVEYTWSQPRWVTPWPRGLADSTQIECTIAGYQAPTAAKQGVAIYSSWSLGFHAAANASQYVWYETELFDLDRAFSQTIFSEEEEEASEGVEGGRGGGRGGGAAAPSRRRPAPAQSTRSQATPSSTRTSAS